MNVTRNASDDVGPNLNDFHAHLISVPIDYVGTQTMQHTKAHALGHISDFTQSLIPNSQDQTKKGPYPET